MAIATASFAHDGDKDGHKGPNKDWKEKVFKEMDANNDGKVSKDEYLAYEGKKFDEIDVNKKGALTPEDFEAHHKAMMEKFHKDHPKKSDNSTTAPATDTAPVEGK